MSPHEMRDHREAFNQACGKLGWRLVEVQRDHERDWDCSWKEQVWLNAAGKRLFSETQLSLGLLEEVIRIAGGST